MTAKEFIIENNSGDRLRFVGIDNEGDVSISITKRRNEDFLGTYFDAEKLELLQEYIKELICIRDKRGKVKKNNIKKLNEVVFKTAGEITYLIPIEKEMQFTVLKAAANATGYETDIDDFLNHFTKYAANDLDIKLYAKLD